MMKVEKIKSLDILEKQGEIYYGCKADLFTFH